MSNPKLDRLTITLPPAMTARDVGSYAESGMHPAEKCALCRDSIEDGDPVRKVDDGWMHETCAVAAITQADGDAAWLILADMISARPSTFRASDIRAVMANVARIARRSQASEAAS